MKSFIKRKIVITFIIITCIVSMASMALFLKEGKAKESGGVQFVIGMSQANLSEPWRISMNEEIVKEAAKYKNVKVIYRDAGGDTDKQEKDIDELLRSGIDLLIVSINDSQKLTPIVSKAYKSIPVIVLDRAVEGYDYTLYIGPDNESIGRQAGYFVSNLVGNKEANVIEVQGLLDSPPVIGRSKGFRDVLKDHKNINIYRTVICDWQRDEAEDEVEEILKDYKNISVIFAHNDYMALGAYKAVNKLGLKGIKIIGIDGLKGENGGLDLVQKGILEGTFTCTTGGKEAVDYAIDILNKKQGIPKKIILRSDKITKSNVNEYLNAKTNNMKCKKKIVMGYAQLNSESKWRDANEKSIKDAAKDYGIDLIFLKSGSTQNDQKKLIRELIKKKVDIISFSPVVESNWDDVLSEAKKAQIPVIISDRSVDSDESLWVCNIGSDFYEEGKRAARQMLGYYNDVKGSIKILEIKGNRGSSPTIERDSGFREIIKKYSNYKIIDYRYGDFTYEGGKKAMETFLKAYGDKAKVIYAQNDDMALGAISAIREYNLIPGKDIIVIGTDATKPALEAVKQGEMLCTVECNPLLGSELMNVAREIIENKEVPLRITDSEEIFINNITNKEINNRKY